MAGGLQAMSAEGDQEDGVDGSSLLAYDAEAANEESIAGCLPLEGSVSIEIIFVCELDGRTLVAVFQVGWNRRAGPRKLPQGSLTRATAVEVAGTARSSCSEIAVGARVKIWLGFLEDALVPAVSFADGAPEPDFKFVATNGDAGFLPHSGQVPVPHRFGEPSASCPGRASKLGASLRPGAKAGGQQSEELPGSTRPADRPDKDAAENLQCHREADAGGSDVPCSRPRHAAAGFVSKGLVGEPQPDDELSCSCSQRLGRGRDSGQPHSGPTKCGKSR